MAMLPANVGRMMGAVVLLFVLAAVSPVSAQQPVPVSPSGSVATEEQLLQRLRQIEGRGSIPDVKSQVIEQPLGHLWRSLHEVAVPRIGIVTIVGIIALLAVFYLVRGTVRIDGGRSGLTILRFNSFERFIHWLIGVSFVILALTGLNITFGKKMLLPLIGPEAFSNFSIAAKYAHNYMSFPFVLGTVVLFLIWMKDNFPTSADVQWLKEGGGFVGSKHPPAWRFNAGQKMLFWFVIGASTAVAVSGYFLMFPFYWTNILGMQVAQVVHGAVAMLFVSLIIAHIYIGTLGMEGGFDAMADGKVDLNWAKQHHRLWLEKKLGQGRAANPPAGASATPAE
jgi:formate dehydrogenase subunit gamma